MSELSQEMRVSMGSAQRLNVHCDPSIFVLLLWTHLENNFLYPNVLSTESSSCCTILFEHRLASKCKLWIFSLSPKLFLFSNFFFYASERNKQSNSLWMQRHVTLYRQMFKWFVEWFGQMLFSVVKTREQQLSQRQAC